MSRRAGKVLYSPRGSERDQKSAPEQAENVIG